MDSEQQQAVANSAKPSVVDLASESRIAVIPETLRMSAKSPKGHKGLCVGRKEELLSLADYYTTQWKGDQRGELNEDDCVAALLTNAPGAGKTTLRQQFALEQAKQGIAVIEISVGELARDERLIRALQSYADQPTLKEALEAQDETAGAPPGPTKVDEDDGGKEGGIVSAREGDENGTVTGKIRNVALRLLMAHPTAMIVGGVIMYMGGDAGGVMITVGALQTLQDQHDAFREVIRKEPPVDGVTALAQLSATHHGRFIIAVDECHTMLEDKGSGPDLLLNIEALANPTVRQKSDIGGGGLLLCGLGNFADQLDGFGLTRAQVIWLDELNEAQSMAIIGHYISQAHIDGERRARVIDPWTIELARTFTHWPQHAAAAGRFAQLMLERTEPDSVDPEERERLDWVRTLTAREIARLYNGRIKAAAKSVPNVDPEAVAALATVSGGRMPRKAVTLTVTAGMREIGEAVTAEGIERAITGLKRAGLLRDGEGPIRRDAPPADLRMGVPSLRRYIIETTPPALMRVAEVRAASIMAAITEPANQVVGAPPSTGDGDAESA